MASNRERLTQYPKQSKDNPGKHDVLQRHEKQKMRHSEIEQKRGPQKPKDIE